MRAKKIPVRMCVGCGEHKEKGALVRIVKQKDGSVLLDLTGKTAGRGAYICKSTECLTKAKKARRLENAFSMQIDASVYEALEKGLEDAEQ